MHLYEIRSETGTRSEIQTHMADSQPYLSVQNAQVVKTLSHQSGELLVSVSELRVSEQIDREFRVLKLRPIDEGTPNLITRSEMNK